MIKTSIEEYFSVIVDMRDDRRKLHKLIDIIIITVCAVISGANDWVAVETFGNAREEWLKTFLQLENGIPSHDTFSRVFRLINPEQFRKCFVKWMESIAKLKHGEVVAVDGKTLRRSYDKEKGKEAIHMISAFATENGVVWGQIKTNEKSNEITAVPELLEVLALEGCIVTTDAMNCQKDIAEKVIKKKADYVLALKGNHKRFYEDVKLFLDDALKTGFKEIPHEHYHCINKGHGRTEKRDYYITDKVEWLFGREEWMGLKSIGVAITEIDIKGNKSKEHRYYISSLEPNAEKFGNAVRKHWGVESFHWTLDVTFKEDYNRCRKDCEAENLAIARHMAINILRQEKTIKASIEKKRFKCALEVSYLDKVIFGES